MPQEKRKIILRTLHGKAKQLKISDYKIAERIGTQRPNIPRMLSGEGSIRLDTFISLCDAIDVDIFESILNSITNKQKEEYGKE